VVVADLGKHPRSGEPADAGEAVHDGRVRVQGERLAVAAARSSAARQAASSCRTSAWVCRPHSGLDQW
jgi:hypothetical protein